MNQSTTQIVSEEPPLKLSKLCNAQIQALLENLTPIPMYGYYHGGYNYTYQHHIVGAIANTKTSAIELALQTAAMVI